EFILPNGAARSPDACWVALSRIEALTPKQRSRFGPLCPDFVVELTSPSDRLPKLQAKMREYMENGAKLGWLLHVAKRTALSIVRARMWNSWMLQRNSSAKDL